MKLLQIVSVGPALVFSISGALGQTPSDYAVRVSATVQTNPPQIRLTWPADSSATGYTLYRKSLGAPSWNAGTSLPADATDYVDSSVSAGGAEEYWVLKTTPTHYGNGIIYAGIEVPLVESRGKVELIVDQTFSSTLSNELARLEQDLSGDGWTVLRHDVPRMAVAPGNTSPSVWGARSNELASVKALIQADYDADPANVKAVFLFGHVPVSYSGAFAPDNHYYHVGAWPADVYYGDMHGAWTDSGVAITTASDPRNWNQPGDGKFDQSTLPTNVDLEVGRVDFANLPAFAQSEEELLRQYLNKDHSFREGFVNAAQRGLIDDHFGVSGLEAVAADGWRTFAPFFGATNTFASSDWFGTLCINSYLWAYGCGSGTYTSAAGVGNTWQFTTNDPQVVFTMLFGSYFGDWDSQNNFLRAGLCTPTYTLACVWAGRPFWEFHHMALGETIGYSTLVSQENNIYPAGSYDRYVHVALMGDPTLRMNYVAPASALVVVKNGSSAVDLSWAASPDGVAGYNVYRAATVAGPFTRLNGALLTGTTYTDPLVSSNVYMVRAVKLQVTGSGSYWNASEGIFQSLDPSVSAPSVELLHPGDGAIYGAPASIQIDPSTFDYANCITQVLFYADGMEIGESDAAPFSFTWNNVPVGTNVLTAVAVHDGGLTTNSSPVTVNIRTVLTITAQNTNKVYGEALPAFTATYSGFINGDTPASLTTLPSFSSGGQYSSVGNYSITPSGAVDPVYYMVYVPGTLTITKASATGTVIASANPALPGAAVTFTNTLSAVAPGGGTPTGTVQFTTNGVNAGSAVSLSSGVAKFSTSGLAHGTNVIGAGYAGDGNFIGTTNYMFEVIDTPPVISPVTIERGTNSGVKVSASALVGSASDADGDPLSLAGVEGTSAQGGTVVLSNGWVFYTPPQGYTGVDTFNYTISDGLSAPVQGTVTVDLQVDNGPSPNLAIVDLGDGSYQVWGDGIPGRTYHIQYTGNLQTTDWQTIGTAVADTNGVFLFEDAGRGTAVFYRSVYP